MESIDKNRADIIGPIINPDMPNKNIPPKVENKIIIGCISVPLPTSTGLSKLSIKLMTNVPTINIIMPCKILPVANITSAAGNQIIKEPNAGTMHTMVMITPHKSAPLMPTDQNNSPPSVPWMPPTIKVVLRVDKAVVRNFS